MKKLILWSKSLLILTSIIFFTNRSTGTVWATLPETVLTTLTGIGNLHDIVINCDMIQVDEDGAIIKAIAWDNGERPVTMPSSGNQAQAWFYIEDYNGNSLVVTLPTDSKQPDIVLANDITGTYDYIVGVVFAIGDPFTNYNYGDLWIYTYGLSNVGTAGITATFIGLDQLNNNGIPALLAWGYGDANPHIDMWSDPSNPVNGHPGLHEFAAT